MNYKLGVSCSVSLVTCVSYLSSLQYDPGVLNQLPECLTPVDQQSDTPLPEQASLRKKWKTTISALHQLLEAFELTRDTVNDHKVE